MVKKLPKIITKEEFEQIFTEAYISENKTKKKLRKNRIRKYRIAMLLGFEAGMRISEIVGLEGRVPELNKSNIEKEAIRIIEGKGKKDRVVPKPKRLNDKAIKLLPLNIKRRALQSFVTKLGKNVLKKKITFHTLRHGFASHLVNNNIPLHEVQMLMGHSRLDTTGIYLHANPKKAIKSARESF